MNNSTMRSFLPRFSLGFRSNEIRVTRKTGLIQPLKTRDTNSSGSSRSDFSPSAPQGSRNVIIAHQYPGILGPIRPPYRLPTAVMKNDATNNTSATPKIMRPDFTTHRLSKLILL
jgi:hypothetical protein